MTTRAQGGRFQRARLCRCAAILTGVVMASSTASASDADLQKALLGSGCAAPRIETVLQQRDLVAYRANCTGTPHRIITIVCAKGQCVPGPSNGDRGRP